MLFFFGLRLKVRLQELQKHRPVRRHGAVATGVHVVAERAADELAGGGHLLRIETGRAEEPVNGRGGDGGEKFALRFGPLVACRRFAAAAGAAASATSKWVSTASGRCAGLFA